MPTTYAHYYFGEECYQSLTPQLKEIVEQYRSIYDFGVHGPDIFFYDIFHYSISKLATTYHYEPFKKFLENSKEVLNNNIDNHRPMMAYLLGYLSHFTFDSCAHSYVQAKVEASDVSHNKIESEYDRHLEESNGLNTLKYDRASTLKPSKQSAKVIASFFGLSVSDMYRVLKMHHLLIHLLNVTGKTSKNIKTKLLLLAKKNDYVDLLFDLKEYEPCKDSNLRLDKLRKEALRVYTLLLDNFITYYQGQTNLMDYFEHDFCEWSNYKQIAVLPYEEELQYSIEPQQL